MTAAVVEKAQVTEVDEPQNRWERRPRLASLVRLVVFLAPAVIATDISLVLTRLLPEPEGVPATITWWVVVLAVSGAALLGFDRLFRRLLPFTVLLDLALVFPGVAPSRFSSAFRAGSVRNLQRRLEHAKEHAEDASTIEAASTVVELVAALAVHDPKTRGHSERTRAYSDLIAEELGLSTHDRDRLRWSALLHDIGKLHVRSTLLNKAGRPDPGEWEVLRSHPREGARIVGSLRHWLGPWALAIEQHHERFDGAGYPEGLAGERISLGGRIVSVADAYEVMTSARSYTPPVHPAAAREELVRCAGSHFDPAVVRAFLRVAVGRFPRRAGFLVLLAQLPGFAAFQSLAQQAGSAVVAGVAVTGLAVGGAVGPTAPGLEGALPFESPSSDPSAPAASGRPSVAATSGRGATTVPSASSSVPSSLPPGAVVPPPTSPPATDVVPPSAPTAAPPPPTPPPPPPARGGSYLGSSGGGGQAALTPVAPGGEGAPDYDGDGLPGRTLAPSSRAATTSDPAEHQLWIQRFGGAVTITGTPQLVISSAVPGFEAGRGTLRAFLLDCDGGGGDCASEPIATASLSEADWSQGSGDFTTKTLDFSKADHVLGAGRSLVLRLAVKKGSEPLMLAYGTSSHPAFLSFS